MRWIKYIPVSFVFYLIVWLIIHLNIDTESPPTGVATSRLTPRRYVEGRRRDDVKNVANATVKMTGAPHTSSKKPEASSVEYRKRERGERALLSLFTVLLPDRPLGGVIQKRILKNWGSLSPAIKPYLFVDRSSDARWRTRAVADHWQTLPIGRRRSDLPVFKDMLQTIDERVDSVFIGFAKNDLLFDDTLTDTLNYMKTAVNNIDSKQILLVGRRHDYVINDVMDTFDGTDLSRVNSLSSSLPLARSDVIDYVIFSRVTFHWDDIPDIVVGAGGLTNWILTLAFDWNYIVIEVTSSVNALHLEPPPNNNNNNNNNNNSNNHSDTANSVLLADDPDAYLTLLKRGQTLCVNYLTICRRWRGNQQRKNKRCNFALAKRKTLPTDCKLRKQKEFFIKPKQATRSRREKAGEPEEYDTFEGEMVL